MEPGKIGIGQTRCYWSLLSTDLNFIYLDPVLASHLEDQKDVLVGKPLLSFVHPDEVNNAKADLGNMLQSRTLHGTVTRVRFSRLSRVRRILGYTGPKPAWSDAEKIAVDENYMVVDIVINYAAEGVVLCFIHATVDLTPEDNDPSKKSGWTNWCSTPWMPQEEIQVLLSRLAVYAPHSSSAPLTRAFQILQNVPNRPLLMSWPPDPAHTSSLTAKHFSSLSDSVDMGDLTSTPGANTSCTRRYRSVQYIESPDQHQVESIFIPHGSIIFACHKVEQSDPTTNSSVARPSPISHLHQMGYNATATMPPANASYYPQQPQSYSLPPISTNPHQYAYMPSQQAAAHYKYDSGPAYSGGRYDSYPNGGGGGQQQWSSTSRSGYWTQQPQPQQYMNDGAPPPAHDPYYSSQQIHSYTQALPPPDRDSTDMDQNDIAALVPPPRRRVDHHGQYDFSATLNGQDSSRNSTAGSEQKEGRAGKTSRNSGNRPAGVLRCSSCKATSSPEWRKGPSGKKELCNACGLRYARSRAKKEGAVNNHHTSTSHPYQSNGRKRKSGPTSSSSLKPSSNNNSIRSVSETPSPSSATASLNSSLSSIGSSMGYSPGPGQYSSTPPPQGGTGLTMMAGGIGMNSGSLPPLQPLSGGGNNLHHPLQSLQIQPYQIGGVRRGFVGGYDAQASPEYGRPGSASPGPHSAGYKLTYPPSIPSPLAGIHLSTPGDRRSPNEQITSFERDTTEGRDRGRDERVKREPDAEEDIPDNDDDDDEYIDASERRRGARRSVQRGKNTTDRRPREIAHDRYGGDYRHEEVESAHRLSTSREILS